MDWTTVIDHSAISFLVIGGNSHLFEDFTKIDIQGFIDHDTQSAFYIMTSQSWGL